MSRIRGGGGRGVCFFLMIRRPPRSTLDRSSAASDVYKRQGNDRTPFLFRMNAAGELQERPIDIEGIDEVTDLELSLIHISEPTRPY